MSHITKVPKLRKPGSANVGVFVPYKEKREKVLDTCKFPRERPDNWREIALNTFRDILSKFRSVKLFLDTCVHCGACADKCHYFLGTGDPMNMPVARAELMRKVYKRYFTPAGKLGAGAELNEEMLDKWYTYFHQCSECRRCSVFCPYGIDTAEITIAARTILGSIGYASKYVAEVIDKCHRIGNNLGINPQALKDSCEFLEEEIEEETGLSIKIPIDVEGAEVLLINPSADYFGNPHTDATVGYAKVFYKAGISWTISTYASEGGNFGMFTNYYHLKKINKRMVDAAKALKVKKMVMGECGHAWRNAQAFTDTLNGPLDFLEKPRPQHICEFTLDLIKKGALKFDKSRNDDVYITYHDPCNAARAGGIMDEPREIIKHVANYFAEMPRNTIREYTFCCTGGGGVLADELKHLRALAAKPRIDAWRATRVDVNGEKKLPNYMATPCAICKATWPHNFEYWKVDDKVRIGGVHDLVSKAIIL